MTAITGKNPFINLDQSLKQSCLAFLSIEDLTKVARLSKSLELQVNQCQYDWKHRTVKCFGTPLASRMYERTKNWQVAYNQLIKLQILAKGILRIQEVQRKRDAETLEVRDMASRVNDVASRVFGFSNAGQTYTAGESSSVMFGGRIRTFTVLR